jgi:hypothetical protein
MAKMFRSYVPEQDLLLPPSLRDWLPANHLAYFVSELVDALDLSAITAPYEEEERGFPPYHPVMLTKVLLYAYCVGVFSSRRIQRRLAEDVAFRVLAADIVPVSNIVGTLKSRTPPAIRACRPVGSIATRGRLRTYAYRFHNCGLASILNSYREIPRPAPSADYGQE